MGEIKKEKEGKGKEIKKIWEKRKKVNKKDHVPGTKKRTQRRRRRRNDLNYVMNEGTSQEKRKNWKTRRIKRRRKEERKEVIRGVGRKESEKKRSEKVEEKSSGK